MATYAQVSNGSTATYVPTVGTDPTAGLLSTFQAGQSATNIASPIIVYHQATVATLRAAEKLNTRSAAPRANYYRDGIGNINNRILYLYQRDFGTNAWRAQPRACPRCDDSNVLDSESVLAVGLFDEEVQGKTWSIRGRRKCRTPGFWAHLGNNSVDRFSAAVSARYPVFFNDIVWADPSAWRNGTNRQSTRNMPLLNASAPQRTMRGVGI